MHKTMEEVMNAGALGIEIVISGKIPGSRAKSWRVFSGYLKKCGDIAITGVHKASVKAVLKTGVVGVKVSIMPPDINLPDSIKIIDEMQKEKGEVKKEDPAEKEKKEQEDKKEEIPVKEEKKQETENSEKVKEEKKTKKKKSSKKTDEKKEVKNK